MDTKIIDTEKYTRFMMVGHFYNIEDFDDFKAEMDKLISKRANTLIDISKVTFLNSRGLGIFVTVARKFSENNLKCILYCPREEITETIKIAGIDMVVSIIEKEVDIESSFAI